MIGVYGTVYNSADTVGVTLRDLERKLPDDFIVVISDNYSSDGTYEILQSFDNVDAFQVRATRGRGRQLALERLLRRYGGSVQYIFSLDLDVVFPDYFPSVVAGLIGRYSGGEVYGTFASAQTYQEILHRGIVWPDLNMAEDIGYDIELIRHGFRKYLIGFPFWHNQVRRQRETKYAKGWKYFRRMFNIYVRSSLLYKHVFLPIKVRRFFASDYLMDNAYLLFPEDVGVSGKYLAAWGTYSRYSFPESFKRAIEEHPGDYHVLVARGKDRLTYQFLLYRDADAVSDIIQFFTVFHDEKVWAESVENLL